jgi:hypothetical protein
MSGEDMAHLRQDASDIADDIREAYLRGKAEGIRESIKWAAGPHSIVAMKKLADAIEKGES